MGKKTSPFAFRHFIVHHDRCSMKIGTDAVLLGAWTRVAGAKTMLDIGTGSGILALMLAQRASPEARIDALEIAQPDFLQANENARHSPWPEKIKVHPTSIQAYRTKTKYDLIVCNPPYFINSLLPASPSRKLARHTTSLSNSDLLSAVKRLLSDQAHSLLFSPLLRAFNLNPWQKDPVCIAHDVLHSFRESKSHRNGG